jgi:hypothetical protein
MRLLMDLNKTELEVQLDDLAVHDCCVHEAGLSFYHYQEAVEGTG